MVLEKQALGGQQLPEQLTAHMAQVAVQMASNSCGWVLVSVR